jgi:hypothetical protein
LIRSIELTLLMQLRHIPKRHLHLLNVPTYLCFGRSRSESWDGVSDSSGEDSTSRIVVSRLQPAWGWHVAVRYIVQAMQVRVEANNSTSKEFSSPKYLFLPLGSPAPHFPKLSSFHFSVCAPPLNGPLHRASGECGGVLRYSQMTLHDVRQREAL